MFIHYLKTRRGPARGAALVTVVLLSVIGATIALASLWVALGRTRAAAADRDSSSAQSSMLSVLGEYEAHLIDNPYYFLERVDRYEQARVCTGDNPPRIVEPGSPWPESCGSFWTYIAAQPSTATGGGALDFSAYPITVFDPGQDAGTFTVLAGGESLLIEGNAWKKMAITTPITPDTVLDFDYSSTDIGEIHGIGFETDNAITAATVFQLAGNQTFGIQDFRTYTTPGTTHYTIPVGTFFTGTFPYITFMNDDDSGATANGTYSNVTITQPASAVSRPEPARIVVKPPSSATPYLTVQAIAESGSVTLARERTYSMRTVASSTIYSDEDLRLDEVVRDITSSLEISGDLYTSGDLSLPTNAAVTLHDGLLMAEEGFFPDVAVTPREDLRWFCNTMPDDSATPADAGTDPDDCPLTLSTGAEVEDIRDIAPAPLHVESLYDDVSRLESIACGPIAAGTANRTDNLSNHLCLRPGQTLRDIGNADRTIDSNAEMFLLRFDHETSGDSSTPQIVEVWSVNRGPSFVQDCLIRCSLPVLAEQERLVGSHMGAINFWSDTDLDGSGVAGDTIEEQGSLVGRFYIPESGVIFSSQDVNVGLCGDAFTSASGTCGISVIDSAVTVLAGTRITPADIYISGPLTVDVGAGTLRDAEGRLGLVATRHVFIPYWARTPEGNLNIDASLLALGIGADYDQGRFRGAISSMPSRVYIGYTGDEANQGDVLTITGALAGEAVDLSMNQYNEIRLEQDPRLLSDAPPYFPSFTSSWDLRTVRDMSPEEICGSFTCPAWTDN